MGTICILFFFMRLVAQTCFSAPRWPQSLLSSVTQGREDLCWLRVDTALKPSLHSFLHLLSLINNVSHKLVRTKWRGEVLFCLHWSSHQWPPITPLKLAIKLCYKESLYFLHWVIELLITRIKERLIPMPNKTYYPL